ncbi:MAG: DNA-3-methyladenine glycosylase I [Planctomycetota bacterium]
MATPSGLVHGADGIARCWWAGTDAAYGAYHDAEWGVPVTEDRRLFEKICLEGFQAGLSWLTILRKREAFRRAFARFDHRKVARFGAADVRRLLDDAGIVRHRGKIEATIQNARALGDLLREFGSLADYVWRFEPGPASRPKRFTRRALSALTTCDEAAAMSKDLKRRGWRFVGPTTAYAFMQAMGLVNDHVDGCPRRAAIEAQPRPRLGARR